MEMMLNKNTPLVSVVMANYNNSRFLLAAIDSVLDQTYKNLEFFIVDDGSNDDSDKIVREYQERDQRIRYIKNEKNLGQSKSRNKAIKLSTGRYVAIVDSDDICLPDRIEEQVAFMESNQDIGVLGTLYRVFSKDSNESVEPENDAVSSKMEDGRVIVHHPTCLIRRNLFEKFGFYDPRYDNAEDVDLFYRWYARGVKFFRLDKILYLYRIHGSNTSVTKIKSQIFRLLKINLRAVIKDRLKFTPRGYAYVIEQIAYLIFLSLGLKKFFRR